MACTSAAIKALNDYVRYTALFSYESICFVYDPEMIWSGQTREFVARFAGPFAKAHGGRKNWFAAAYSRSHLTFRLHKTTSVLRPRTLDGKGMEDFTYRDTSCEVMYNFYSPSPELLEDVEELFIARDLAAVPEATVLLNDDPWKFDVNVAEFQVQNFGHLQDDSEGLISILTVEGIFTAF